MGDRAVVALEEIVDHVLPVRLDVEGQAVREGKLIEIRHQGANLVGQALALLSEWSRVGIQVDEDEGAELLDPYRGQADLALVEVLDVIGVGGVAQLAVQAVGPGVVGAGDDLLGALALEQFMGPVLADIVEGPELAFPAADREKRIALKFEGQVLARVAQPFAVANELP